MSNLDDDADRQELRGEALQELLETEQEYVKSLDIILTEFFYPLLESVQEAEKSGGTVKPILPKALLFQIFGVVVDVAMVNHAFLDALTARFKNFFADIEVADVLLDHFPQFFTPYTTYLGAYEDSMASLEDAEKIKTFRRFLEAKAKGEEYNPSRRSTSARKSTGSNRGSAAPSSTPIVPEEDGGGDKDAETKDEGGGADGEGADVTVGDATAAPPPKVVIDDAASESSKLSAVTYPPSGGVGAGAAVRGSTSGALAPPTGNGEGAGVGQPHDLRALLIMPVQRLPRYQLLLKEAIKMTMETDAERGRLEEALGSVKSIVDKVNETMRQQQNLRKLMELQNSFIGGKVINIVEDNRLFVKDGMLTKVSRKAFQRRKFFLFSDGLAYGDPVPGGKVIFHRFLKFDTMQVQDIEDTEEQKDSFSISNAEKSFVVVADNEDDKASWIRMINQTMDKFKKGSGVDGSPSGWVAPVWVPDRDAAQCGLCHRGFTFFLRRHHCRYCGKCVCHDCSKEKLFLPKIHSNKAVRVCDNCFFNFALKVQRASGELITRQPRDATGTLGSIFAAVKPTKRREKPLPSLKHPTGAGKGPKSGGGSKREAPGGGKKKSGSLRKAPGAGRGASPRRGSKGSKGSRKGSAGGPRRRTNPEDKPKTKPGAGAGAGAGGSGRRPTNPDGKPTNKAGGSGRKAPGSGRRPTNPAAGDRKGSAGSARKKSEGAVTKTKTKKNGPALGPGGAGVAGAAGPGGGPGGRGGGSGRKPGGGGSGRKSPVKGRGSGAGRGGGAGGPRGASPKKGSKRKGPPPQGAGSG